MIGDSLHQPMDSFTKLSRKELQALCKSNGIPANKTNAFMMDALTKKRVPLSQMDSNRDQKVGSSIRSPLKLPPVARKSVSNVNSFGPAQKPPVFTNNFLRRGRRKDPPTSNESEREGQKVPRTNAASGFRKSSTDVLPRPGAAEWKEAGSSIASKEAKAITSRVTSSKSLTNHSKDKIEDRVRSQIDAAMCSVQLSKVKRVPEVGPSAATSSDPSEVVIDSNLKYEDSGAFNLPLEHSEQQKGVGHVKVESREVSNVHFECSEEQMHSFPLPDAPANQSRKQENVSTSTPALSRCTSLALIAASPPISFSPLVRQVEDKVRSIVDRVQNFWKYRELADVNNFGSPVQ